MHIPALVTNIIELWITPYCLHVLNRFLDPFLGLFSLNVVRGWYMLSNTELVATQTVMVIKRKDVVGGAFYSAIMST